MKNSALTSLLLIAFSISYSQSSIAELKNCISEKYYNQDYKGSIECLNKLIVLNPKDSSAYNDRGLIKEILHDYSGAISDFSEQLKIDPTLADTYFLELHQEIG